MSNNNCPLCRSTNETVLWYSDDIRIIAVADASYPGYCRIIWSKHVCEMTDLSEHDRTRLMQVVFVVESGLREFIRPAKINLASLGNQVPHVHWHVIPRFEDDPCFPAAIWAPPVRGPGNVRLLDWDVFSTWLKTQLG